MGPAPDREETVTCVVCAHVILPGEGRYRIQQGDEPEKNYHPRCYERLQAGERQPPKK